MFELYDTKEEARQWNMYHMANRAGEEAARRETEKMINAANQALVLMVKHLRIEHGMSLNNIAKRCGLKVKQVKEFLGEG